jgi:hypothetical protein
MVPERLVTSQVVPALEAYCTDQPATLTAPPPRLNSSTKSLANGAPLLPPPPYTSLITTSGDAAAAGGPSNAATSVARNASTYGDRRAIFTPAGREEILGPPTF